MSWAANSMEKWMVRMCHCSHKSLTHRSRRTGFYFSAENLPTNGSYNVKFIHEKEAKTKLNGRDDVIVCKWRKWHVNKDQAATVHFTYQQSLFRSILDKQVACEPKRWEMDKKKNQSQMNLIFAVGCHRRRSMSLFRCTFHCDAFTICLFHFSIGTSSSC